MKKLLTILLAIATAAMLAIPAFASSDTTVINEDTKGSITVHKYEYNGDWDDLDAGTGLNGDARNVPADAEALNGVTFTLYQVKNTADTLAYFNGSNTTVVTVDDYVTNGAIKTGVTIGDPKTATTSGGVATFSDLDVGFYVLIETAHPANVTSFAAPALIAVPMVNTDTSSNNDNAEWIYDINVYPKNTTSEGGVTLVKQGANGTALSGVTFRLYKDTRAAGAATAVWTKQGDDATTPANGTINWDNLLDGDYYIIETSAPKGYIVDGRPIYFSISQNTVTYDSTKTKTSGVTTTVSNDDKQLTITLKNEKPDLTKEVLKNGATAADWVHDTQYSIGDTIPYRITVAIPANIADLTKFEITDTPTNLKDVVDSVDIAGLTKGTDYTVTASGDGFKVAFVTPLTNDVKALAGGSITITYNAVLQGSAVIFGDGNPNTAKLEYSSKIVPSQGPGSGGDEPEPYSIEDKDVVYTYKAEIVKYKDSVADVNKIANVEFQLLTSATGDAVTVVDLGNGEYRLPVAGETGTTTTTTLKTNSSGKITIKGLENGTYYLKETKTIDGYNLLSAPVELKLNISEVTIWKHETEFDNNGNKVKDYYETNTTTFGGNTTPATTLYAKDIINKKGFTLPQTGGLGTLTLSVIGCALVLGGALVLVNSKKRAK